MITIKELIELLEHYNEDEKVVYRVIDREAVADTLERPMSVKEWELIGGQLDYELDEAMVELDFWFDQKSAEVKED